MRSRFTAFAIGDARYLGDTWHPRTAPASIDLDDALEWRRLEIIGTTRGGSGDDRGTVEFRAHWRMRATGRSARSMSSAGSCARAGAGSTSTATSGRMPLRAETPRDDEVRA
jgi:SEC-C motif-containing protein